MANESDISELISASRGGDKEAKAKLVSCFREHLRLLAHLHIKPLLKSKFDESDIVQETCMQAVECFDQFQGTGERQFAAWLRQILANKGAWMARKYFTEKRDARLEQHLQQYFDQSSVDVASLLPFDRRCPADAAASRERTVILADAIAGMRGDQREVLLLHGLQGISIAEVAESLGRTESSTWKLWARGLQALRKSTEGKL